MPTPLQNITGQTFGTLLVLGKSKKRSGGNTMWHVRCTNCGNKKDVQRCSLLRIKETGCSCGKRQSIEDEMVDQKIDRVTILKFSHLHNEKKMWLLKCDCGEEFTHPTGYINRAKKKGMFACQTCLRSHPESDLAKKKLLHELRNNAQLRGIDWQLSDKETLDITSKNCHYCGSRPTLKTRSRADKNNRRVKFRANGIDRINSDRPYTSTNTVPCCSYCNNLKSDLKPNEFLDQVRKIAVHFLSQKGKENA